MPIGCLSSWFPLQLPIILIGMWNRVMLFIYVLCVCVCVFVFVKLEYDVDDVFLEGVC